MFESKKWVVAAEATAIKRTKAYDGGDHVLFAIHKLDIMRKHERLLRVQPLISQANITAWGPGIETGLRYLNDKTVLYRISKSRRFRPSKGNTFLTAEIFLNEPAIGVPNKPAILALLVFITRVRVRPETS